MKGENARSEIDVSVEWQKLCEEHEVAKNAYFQAFIEDNQKFIAIGLQTSKANPSEEELSKFETTWSSWEDVKRRLNDFVKAYA
jgi:hypothetical protein